MAERTSILLIGGYIGALALGAFELQRSSSLPVADPDQTGQAIPALELPPDTIRGIAAYDAITERPVFNRNRLPISENAVRNDDTRKVTPDNDIQGMRLTAVLKGPANLTVLLEDQAGETRRMHIGDKLGKWQIEEILDDQVVMTSGSSRQTLLVHRFDPPPIRKTSRRKPTQSNRQITRQPARKIAPRTPVPGRRSDNQQDNP